MVTGEECKRGRLVVSRSNNRVLQIHSVVTNPDGRVVLECKDVKGESEYDGEYWADDVHPCVGPAPVLPPE